MNEDRPIMSAAEL